MFPARRKAHVGLILFRICFLFIPSSSLLSTFDIEAEARFIDAGRNRAGGSLGFDSSASGHASQLKRPENGRRTRDRNVDETTSWSLFRHRGLISRLRARPTRLVVSKIRDKTGSGIRNSRRPRALAGSADSLNSIHRASELRIIQLRVFSVSVAAGELLFCSCLQISVQCIIWRPLCSVRRSSYRISSIALTTARRMRGGRVRRGYVDVQINFLPSIPSVDDFIIGGAKFLWRSPASRRPDTKGHGSRSSEMTEAISSIKSFLRFCEINSLRGSEKLIFTSDRWVPMEMGIRRIPQRKRRRSHRRLVSGVGETLVISLSYIASFSELCQH